MYSLIQVRADFIRLSSPILSPSVRRAHTLALILLHFLCEALVASADFNANFIALACSALVRLAGHCTFSPCTYRGPECMISSHLTMVRSNTTRQKGFLKLLYYKCWSSNGYFELVLLVFLLTGLEEGIVIIVHRGKEPVSCSENCNAAVHNCMENVRCTCSAFTF